MPRKMSKEQKEAWKALREGARAYKPTRIIDGKRYAYGGGPYSVSTAKDLARDIRLGGKHKARIIRLKTGKALIYATGYEPAYQAHSEPSPFSKKRRKK